MKSISYKTLITEYSWLKNSGLFAETDFTYGITTYICKPDEPNFDLLFQVIVLWEVDYFPPELFDNLLKFQNQDIQLHYNSEFERKTSRKISAFLTYYPDQLSHNSACLGYFDMLEYCFKRGLKIDQNLDLYCVQRIDVLRKLGELGYQFKAKTLNHAIFTKNIECLELLFGFGAIPSESNFIEWSRDPNTDVFNILIKYNCPWNAQVYVNLASKGDIENILLVRQHGYSWNEKTADSAAFHGRLDCLKFLIENGCPVGKDIVRKAVFSRNRDCVVFLMENLQDYETHLLIANSIRKGGLNMLEFLHKNGFEIKNSDINSAIVSEDSECLLYCLKFANLDSSYKPFSFGNCEILRILLEHGVYNPKFFLEALTESNLEALNILHESGYRPQEDILELFEKQRNHFDNQRKDMEKSLEKARKEDEDLQKLIEEKTMYIESLEKQIDETNPDETLQNKIKDEKSSLAKMESFSKL